MTQFREKFATQVDSEVLKAIKTLAAKEGRQIQSLVDEALSDLLDKRDKMKPRSPVLEAYMSSHEDYSDLYQKLAE